MMPGMSDDQLVYAVRAHVELDAVPIVLLSGRTNDTLRVQLLHAGAQDYLVKPFHPEELRVRVANLIKMKQAHQLLQREVADQYQDIAALANAVTARTSSRVRSMSCGKTRPAQEPFCGQRQCCVPASWKRSSRP